MAMQSRDEVSGLRPGSRVVLRLVDATEISGVFRGTEDGRLLIDDGTAAELELVTTVFVATDDVERVRVLTEGPG
jgi:hypothetical protein